MEISYWFLKVNSTCWLKRGSIMHVVFGFPNRVMVNNVSPRLEDGGNRFISRGNCMERRNRLEKERYAVRK